MPIKKVLCAALAALALSGCGVVYRIDVPQGSYVEQKQIDKLRIGMSREQVAYVLGSPMMTDSFANDTWYYLYEFTEGWKDTERKELSVTFRENRLIAVQGDFPLPAAFNTPLE